MSAAKDKELFYDMVSKNPSPRARRMWYKIFDDAKKDQDKILELAKKK